MVFALASSLAAADSITFNVGTTAMDTAGDPVFAQAVVTTSNGTITVVLTNLLGVGTNPSITDVGQLLSDFSFTLSGRPGTVAYPTGNTGTGILISVAADGSFDTPSATTLLGWSLSSSSDTVSLEGLTKVSGTPDNKGGQNLLLGAPCSSGSGAGKYCNGNGSIDANAGHNPFAENGATFTIDASGVTSATDITAATFSFGTTAGDVVPGVPVSAVPEPATWVLLSSGLLGLGLVARRNLVG